jgi:hypothetical protein
MRNIGTSWRGHDGRTTSMHGSATRAARSITVAEKMGKRSGRRRSAGRSANARPRRCPEGLDELLLGGFPSRQRISW